jgi:hypothetical protein
VARINLVFFRGSDQSLAFPAHPRLIKNHGKWLQSTGKKLPDAVTWGAAATFEAALVTNGLSGLVNRVA